MRSERVERVPRLVEKRHHIVDQPDRVHEDERAPTEVERLAVATRRLALPTVEIEQPLVDHGLELAAKERVHPIEDPRAAPTNCSTVSNGRSGAAR